MPFEARELPEAVMFADGEIVSGPFCRHCGYPFTMHGPAGRCRVDPNMLMGPICDCHEIREVEHLVRSGRRGMPNRIQKVRRIVRTGVSS